MVRSCVVIVAVCVLFLFSLGVHPTNITKIKSFSQVEPKKQVVFGLRFYSSKHSPIFEPNASFAHRLGSEMNMSLHRIAYLQEKTKIGSNVSANEFREEPDHSHIMPRAPAGLYLVMLYVGPEQEIQFLVLDTGSSFIWVHCNPCENVCRGPMSIQVPVYDPMLSNNKHGITCQSLYCEDSGGAVTDCDEHHRCVYLLTYGSGTSAGVIRKDVFLTSDGSNLGEFYFGCSKYACFEGLQRFFFKNQWRIGSWKR